MIPPPSTIGLDGYGPLFVFRRSLEECLCSTQHSTSELLVNPMIREVEKTYLTTGFVYL
jgi:hypothetical protein